MKDSKITEYQNKLSKFIDSSNYYGTLMHPKQCQICKMDREERLKIDNLLLKDAGIQTVKLYLLDVYPGEFDPANVERCIRQHKKYLPYLLEEIKYKSMFRRAREHLADLKKSPDEMTMIEKLELLTELEEEILKEYANFENERMSLINVFYKETFPLLMTRLHNEIISGQAKNIRDVTLASETIFKMADSISKATSIGHVEDKEKELNFNNIDEKPIPSTKEKIVSLTEKINKATEGKTG